jgi:hypothetical protein
MSFTIAFWVLLAVWVGTVAGFITYVTLNKHNVKWTTQELPAVMRVLSVLHNQQREETPDVVGVIVEPRDHVNLIPVLENFLTVLPDLYVYVFHGILNHKRLIKAFGEHPKRLRYVPLEQDNITMAQYNYLLTRPSFYDNLSGRHLLVFQTDAVLFSNSLVKIQDLLMYDYVGAPWKKYPNKWSGNGGLSLRRRDLMAKIAKEIPYISGNEDRYFAEAFRKSKLQVVLAKPAVSRNLFYESVEPQTLPFGAHKYLPQKFISEVTDDERAIIENYSHK